MPILILLILGLIQGLTEFLPVSSSGHLAVAQYLFGLEGKDDVVVEILAHFGSLASILFFYRKDFLSFKNTGLVSHKEKALPLIISVIPAGILGFLFHDYVVNLFSNMNFVATGFLITSFLLLSLKYLETKVSLDKNESELMNWPTPFKALLIGFAQAFALFPGISRSGSTIVAGVWLGLKPKQAAFFSFCSVIPLIGGATLNVVIKMFANFEAVTISIPGMIVLLLSSFFFGWIGLLIVDKFLEKDKFFYFSFYLIPLSLLMFFV